MRMWPWMVTLSAIGVLALSSMHACTPQMTIASGLGEEEAASWAQFFAWRRIDVSVERVDDTHFDVRIPPEREYDAKYALEDFPRGRFQRPARYGAALPPTRALQEKARALEAKLLETKPNVLRATVVLLEPADPDGKPWAFVGVVAKHIEGRTKDAFYDRLAWDLVAAETDIDWRDVHVTLLHERD